MKPYTIEYVKDVAKQRGFICLSDTYINIKSKLLFECLNGHNIEMSFDNFKYGQGCSICYGNKKIDIEYITNYLKKYNYELISNKYKNSRTKLKMKCPKGHIFKMTWDSFKFGYRCNICGGTLKKEYKDVIFDCVDNIDKYRKIRENGMKFARKEHSIQNRLNTIYNIIDSIGR